MSVIVKIKGGLGNQMFQYAFSLLLAQKYEVMYDLSYFDNENSRPLELETIFDIKLQTVSQKRSLCDYQFFLYVPCGKKIKSICKKIKHKLLRLQYGKNYYSEKSISYDPTLPASRHTYYDGYFQSYKYYTAIKEELRSIFTFPQLDSINQQTAQQIQQTNSVSIHIRRGDYLNNPLFEGICTEEYYTKAIEMIKSKVKNPHFFVFSNDIDWCMENLPLITNEATFVSNNLDKDSYKDMQLMTMCKHNIIANSSFSWWGGYLNNNKTKIIIRPGKWLNDIKTVANDVYDSQWLKITD